MAKFYSIASGIALKCLLDEVAKLKNEYIENKEKFCREIKEYRLAPAVDKGSKEANTAIAKAKYQDAIQPQLAEKRKEIKTAKFWWLILHCVLLFTFLVAMVYVDD